MDERNPSECSCEKCIKGCKVNPGWFMPGEAELVAKSLGLSFKDFFHKYLVVDFWCAEDDVYVLAPYKVFDKIPDRPEISAYYQRPDRGTGRLVDWGYPFRTGRCIFLENDRCRIHPVKPYECRNTLSCVETNGKNIREEIAERWKDYYLLTKLRLNDIAYESMESHSAF